MRLSLSVLFVLFLTATQAQFNVTPLTLTTLSTTVNESSGLVNLGGTLWTHNDSGGLPALFQVNPQDGAITRTVSILQATNVDWEDIAFDCTYVYIGDFGNNSGSRTDLKIYRITRTALASLDAVPAEIIHFSYSDQTSWVPNPNQTDFDCEAFIAYQGNLWLFSKNWVDHKTRLYLLSTEPGTHVAQYQSTFDAEGLVTGAEMLPNDVLVLQSYTSLLSPFNWLFQQFPGQSFFDGLSTKLNWTGISQTEGVCFADTNGIYVSSEKIGFPFNTQATLYYLDISTYFINPPPNGIGQVKPQLVFYSDPLHIYIKSKNRELIPATIRIVNSLGMVLQTISEYFDTEIRIPVQFNKGVYIVNVHTQRWDYSGKIIIY
jgi:hypothetical protein